jgi:SAM-dependent MidA family methyltransferase
MQEDLSDIIIEKIRQEGSIPFREFMEMALYHPGMGYYNTERIKIAPEGDYFTSPVYTSVFGVLIGKQIEEMWRLMDETPFTIVEYGAGTGALCNDLLEHLKSNTRLFKDLRYCIIEKSPAMREREKEQIRAVEKISWHDSITEIPMDAGCVLTNEVLDNFSVDKVVMQDRLMKVCVDHRNGFSEVLEPASDELVEYLDLLGVKLPKGFCTEINLQATRWITEVAAALKKGFVITIDYGHPSAELYSDAWRAGTLKCYSKHSVHDNAYANIGEQDITAHVNFSALNTWGMQSGLSCCGFTDQVHFMHALGIVQHLREVEQRIRCRKDEKDQRLLQTFLLDMGSKFKVMIQQKAAEPALLTGMTFRRKIT